MAESSSSSRKSKPQKVLTDSDMAAAAHQLMQLSGDDEDNNINSKSRSTDEEIDQNRSAITSAKIEEIFGKEEEIFRPKKRRYRSLIHLYMTTKPMNGRRDKRIRY